MRIERVDVFVRIRRAQLQRLFKRHSVRDVTIQRIVRAGLIGQHIGNDSALHHFRQHIGAIADQADGNRLAFFARAASINFIASSSERAILSQ